jgi:peptidoglycan/LPS O-acetylase OafA/YrhL
MMKSFSNHKGAWMYFSSIFIIILLSYIPYALIEIPFMKIRGRLTASINQTKNHKVDNSL